MNVVCRNLTPSVKNDTLSKLPVVYECFFVLVWFDTTHKKRMAFVQTRH